MNRLPLIAFLMCYAIILNAQQNILIFKKGDQPVDRFYKGAYIAFQLKDGEWRKGEITKITGDSFYISPMIIRYSMMSVDTIHFMTAGYALADVFAIPKKGVLIDYINGRFQISRSGGHVHWYWIKSGWILRIGAIGYAALNVTNGIIKNDFTFKGSGLGIAAGVFLFGVLLKHNYKPVLLIGKKYHLEVI